MDRAVLVAFATRYTRAWCSQDAASVASFFSEHGSLSVNGSEPAIGRAAIAELAQGFMAAFPDMVVSLDELEWGASRAIFHWTLAGSNTGPGGTGMRVRISGYEEWEFNAENLIFESKGHFDSAEYERQLQHGVDT